MRPTDEQSGPAHRAPSFDVMHPNHFAYRHIGPRKEDVAEMVEYLGYKSLDALIDAVVPEEIRLRRPLDLPPGRGEREVLQALRGMADQNRIFRSHLGMGYYGTFVPQVIQRNILENPAWYTAYTPYQPEIAQGRLEALLNSDLPAATLAFPVVQLSRKTGDRFRDLPDKVRGRVIGWLERHEAAPHLVRLVREGGQLDVEEQSAAFGESLPKGLRLG